MCAIVCRCRVDVVVVVVVVVLLSSVVAGQIFRTFGGRGWGLRLSDERGAEAGAVLHEYLGEVLIASPTRG